WLRSLTTEEIKEYINIFITLNWLTQERGNSYREEKSLTFISFIRRIIATETEEKEKEMILYLVQDQVQQLKYQKDQGNEWIPKWKPKKETEKFLLQLIRDLVTVEVNKLQNLHDIQQKFNVDIKETGAYKRYQNELKREEIL